MKKSKKPGIFRKIMKVIGVVFLVLILAMVCVYAFVLNYPNLKNDPKVGKWYRLETAEMKASEGGKYHALFRKGNENSVMVYFAGGGVSVDEITAKCDTYNTKLVQPDMLANITMNMGGLASDTEGNPYKDWTLILFPYATGDFDCGTGDFPYTDKDGKEKILYHHGYKNFRAAMDLVKEKAGLDHPENVVVTGYSAGGWAASLLADDVFSDYFPESQTKTVLVDSSMALNPNWKDVAENVWQAPKHITDRIHSDNITMDMLEALHDKWGDKVTLLFGSSTRDSELARVQRYFQTGEINEDTGYMPVENKDGDALMQMFSDTLPTFEKNNVHVFFWDEVPASEDKDDTLTSHTIISTPMVFGPLNDTVPSVAQWLQDGIDGTAENYGVEKLIGEIQ